ncbi:hypothetical protein ACIQZO_19085 [Streptomyces sp. NPDC097617]|uniref:hypothetical protein n=1 Tax=Streptomyces sp. NPDC097617 TaxID=3366091 RepID=UPI003811C17D
MNVVWSVMVGEARFAPLVDPGPLGVVIPDDVMEWASTHGWGLASPKVWITVTTQDAARGAVDGEVAWRDGDVSDGDLAVIKPQVHSQT